MPDNHRIGYVLKMYPRFSETFIVTEIMAREAAGATIEIFSLRPPVDPRFHDTLARVRAPVTYLSRVRRADEVWERLRAATALPTPSDATWRLLLDADPEDASQALDLAAQVRERGLTHLHAHFASTATTVARLAARLAGVTYSFTAHAKDLFHASVSDDDVVAKARDAHHVVTISAYNVAHLRAIGASPENVHLVHNGLDLAAFAPRPAAPRTLGAGDPLRVAAVGRFVEKKGFDVLLDAIALLHRRGEAVHCDLVGAGEADAALRAQAGDLGLGEAVTFHGPLPQDQVRDVVARADVFAAPCVVGADGNADGLPTVVLEAMALGTPCVTTDVTGLVEAIDDERTGLLVGQHDAVGLADALTRVGRDAELAARLVAGARARVEERFDARCQATALEALLPARDADLTGRRVAYVCADPGIGVFGTKGAAVHVQEVVRALRAAGAEVDLFARKTGGRAPADLADVVVHRLEPCPAGMDGPARERWLLDHDEATAVAVAAHGPYDLLYERYSLFSSAGLTGAARAGARCVLEVNAPLVAEQAEHRGLADEDAAWATLRRVAGAADVVACVSEPVRAWATANVPGVTAVVAPNGVNTERITPRTAGSWEAPGGAGRRPVTIGFVGTFKPWHGVELLLEAAAPVVQDDVRLLLVGDGPRADAIDARVRELGIAGHVERTGAVDPGDVPGLLHHIDIAVAPYPATAEDYFSPLKVYEYLAAGLAVVASAVGQIPDVVRDGETGLLTPASDVAALTAALRRLVDDAPLRARLGAAGRELVVARHSWHRTVAGILEAAR